MSDPLERIEHKLGLLEEALNRFQEENEYLKEVLESIYKYNYEKIKLCRKRNNDL